MARGNEALATLLKKARKKALGEARALERADKKGFAEGSCRKVSEFRSNSGDVHQGRHSTATSTDI